MKIVVSLSVVTVIVVLLSKHARRFELGIGLTWRNIDRFSKVIRENKTAQCQDSGFVSTFRLKPKINTIIGDQSRSCLKLDTLYLEEVNDLKLAGRQAANAIFC